MNENLRQYAHQQLKKGDQPPARQEDLRPEIDDPKTVIARLANQREEELRVTQEAVEQCPGSLRQWLFGKK
ncbi:hypothetical protein [Spirosoma sordidisoli]|uniref:hypothetical protein n=1 Tax=Spirosoma sordidisoli TaxID=2502893 RepID=UPI00101C8508|nr:hypothetical protein [Spirosoma sordidisoli]